MKVAKNDGSNVAELRLPPEAGSLLVVKFLLERAALSESEAVPIKQVAKHCGIDASEVEWIAKHSFHSDFCLFITRDVMTDAPKGVFLSYNYIDLQAEAAACANESERLRLRSVLLARAGDARRCARSFFSPHVAIDLSAKKLETGAA